MTITVKAGLDDEAERENVSLCACVCISYIQNVTHPISGHEHKNLGTSGKLFLGERNFRPLKNILKLLSNFGEDPLLKLPGTLDQV